MMNCRRELDKLINVDVDEMRLFRKWEVEVLRQCYGKSFNNTTYNNI